MTGATSSGPTTSRASADPSDERPASPDGSGPPQATLRVEGGDPVTGQLGTYTWGGAGSDSPWLRGAPLKAAAGEPLKMTLRDGVAIARRTARRVPAGSEGGPGATSLGMGPAGPVTFEAPKKGNWSVQVTVEFGGHQGSASYYWQLDVK